MIDRKRERRDCLIGGERKACWLKRQGERGLFVKYGGRDGEIDGERELRV